MHNYPIHRPVSLPKNWRQKEINKNPPVGAVASLHSPKQMRHIIHRRGASSEIETASLPQVTVNPEDGLKTTVW